MELQQKQSATAMKDLLKAAPLENNITAEKNHWGGSNDISGNVIRNPGDEQQLRPQWKNIQFEQHKGDPSKVEIDHETHSVQFKGAATTVLATKAVVPRDGKVWFEVKCSHHPPVKKQ